MNDKFSFDGEIAVKYGVNAAIVYEEIYSQVEFCRKAGINKYEGRYWIKKSINDFISELPFLSHWGIKEAIKKLIQVNLIEVKYQLNDEVLNHTRWFTVTTEKT